LSSKGINCSGQHRIWRNFSTRISPSPALVAFFGASADLFPSRRPCYALRAPTRHASQRDIRPAPGATNSPRAASQGP
jgi:hypothetical protein